MDVTSSLLVLGFVGFLALFITYSVLYVQAKQNTPSAPCQTDISTVSVDFGQWTVDSGSDSSCTWIPVASTDKSLFVLPYNWTNTNDFFINYVRFKAPEGFAFDEDVIVGMTTSVYNTITTQRNNNGDLIDSNEVSFASLSEASSVTMQITFPGQPYTYGSLSVCLGMD